VSCDRKSEPTVRGTAEAIKQMEVDLGLLEDETYGSFARLVWEASRFSVHTVLKQQLAGHGTAHTPTESYRQMRGTRLIRWAVRFLFNALVQGWIWAPRGREWLIVPLTRRRLRPDGVYEDIYTDELVSEIPAHKRRIVEAPYHWEHQQPRPHRVWYSETTMLLAFLLKLWHRPSRKDVSSISRMARDVERYLNDVFCCGFDLRERLSQMGGALPRAIAANRIMLRWLCPKKILLVVSYGHETLITAARSLSIPTVEVQHGVLTPEHIGYSFAEHTTKKSFPDYVLLFGSYWRRTVSWPIESDRLLEIGYPYFSRTKQFYADVLRKERIVCISQGTIGPSLSRFVVDMADQAVEKRRIIYKLHPGEWARWRTEYPWLMEAAAQGTVDVVDGQSPDLYLLLAESTWQLGVNSTALFEGIGLGCKTILVDLPGIEYMDPLVETGAVQVVRQPTDVDWTWTPPMDVSSEEFFADNWQRRFRVFMSRDLTCRSITEYEGTT
jgi:hypothetical protein